MKRFLKISCSVFMLFCFISMTVSENTVHGQESNPNIWWGKNKDRQQEDHPEPKGGSEKERLTNPVSNIVLQQRYPDVLILQGSTTENKVALTFDDGPDPRFTNQVLDVLAQYNVPATFFVMGARAEAYPSIISRIVEEGHIIGNHTYWHPSLVEEELTVLEREVQMTGDALEQLTGYRPSLFRAPYGFLNNERVELLDELGLTIIGWSVDSLDWQEDPPEQIAYNVLTNTQRGSIILMHDGAEWEGDRTNTIESLHQIIPKLKEQGLEFVTVPDLLGIPYQK
ncbi:MAG: polysaccharide deacetylase family protein [Bacillus sp. (in: Bacteria)]|nr:polysaccharide deacetylase family protein [Bacillus sp. (in: firmicutes)]